MANGHASQVHTRCRVGGYDPQVTQEQRQNDICKKYLMEIIEVLTDDDYFDTNLAKASRVRIMAQSWGAVTDFHGHYQSCDECGEQFKHAYLHSEGYWDSRLLCSICNRSESVAKRKCE